MKKILVDTYAFLAAATELLSPKAKNQILKIASGETKGVIHALIIYEILYHWSKGRLPGFSKDQEIIDYLKTYFSTIQLTYEIAREASRMKIKGDNILSQAKDPSLRKRKLSACDAISIAIGKILKIPILTGDKDLTYVAKNMNIDIIW